MVMAKAKKGAFYAGHLADHRDRIRGGGTVTHPHLLIFPA
jgi:hypothetical protein